MKTLWKLILLAWALLYMLTACARPGFAVTYSGIYRATMVRSSVRLRLTDRFTPSNDRHLQPDRHPVDLVGLDTP